MDGRWSVPLAALALMLSGCGDETPRTDDVVLVQSGATATVGPDTPVQKGPVGDLKGHVLDEALRPVAGATVRLPGLDLQRRTADDGGFGFVDLLPGPYYLQADAKGFLPLEAVVDIKEASVSQVRVILVREPSEEPFQLTQKFTGHADLALPLNFDLWGCACAFRAPLPGEADTVVVEAARPQPNGGSFYVEVLDDVGSRIASDTQSDPLLLRIEGAPLTNRTSLFLDFKPLSGPVPETAVEFEVFVTSFHNGDAPQNWSIRGEQA